MIKKHTKLLYCIVLYCIGVKNPKFKTTLHNFIKHPKPHLKNKQNVVKIKFLTINTKYILLNTPGVFHSTDFLICQIIYDIWMH